MFKIQTKAIKFSILYEVDTRPFSIDRALLETLNREAILSQKLRVRSFGVIWIRISDARSVWIMVHQRNQ